MMLLISSAKAGGMSWIMKVENFTRSSETSAVVAVKILSHQDLFPQKCSKAKLFLNFEPNLVFKTSIDRFVSKENQIRSLSIIEQAW